MLTHARACSCTHAHLLTGGPVHFCMLTHTSRVLVCALHTCTHSCSSAHLCTPPCTPLHSSPPPCTALHAWARARTKVAQLGAEPVPGPRGSCTLVHKQHPRVARRPSREQRQARLGPRVPRGIYLQNQQCRYERATGTPVLYRYVHAGALCTAGPLAERPHGDPRRQPRARGGPSAGSGGAGWDGRAPVRGVGVGRGWGGMCLCHGGKGTAGIGEGTQASQVPPANRIPSGDPRGSPRAARGKEPTQSPKGCFLGGGEVRAPPGLPPIHLSVGSRVPMSLHPRVPGGSGARGSWALRSPPFCPAAAVPRRGAVRVPKPRASSKGGRGAGAPSWGAVHVPGTGRAARAAFGDRAPSRPAGGRRRSRGSCRGDGGPVCVPPPALPPGPAPAAAAALTPGARGR